MEGQRKKSQGKNGTSVVFSLLHTCLKGYPKLLTIQISLYLITSFNLPAGNFSIKKQNITCPEVEFLDVIGTKV
jgi:hypothetical protein